MDGPIYVTANDRVSRKLNFYCSRDDTILNVKQIIGLIIKMKPEKIDLRKGNIVLKDHIKVSDYEIFEGFNFELYYL